MMPYNDGKTPLASPYSKWFWEAMKVIGAAAIATILALQIGVSRHDEQIRQIRADIENLRTEGHRLHGNAEREREKVSEELTRIRNAIYEHELEAMRRALQGNGKR